MGPLAADRQFGRGGRRRPGRPAHHLGPGPGRSVRPDELSHRCVGRLGGDQDIIGDPFRRHRSFTAPEGDRRPRAAATAPSSAPLTELGPNGWSSPVPFPSFASDGAPAPGPSDRLAGRPDRGRAHPLRAVGRLAPHVLVGAEHRLAAQHCPAGATRCRRAPGGSTGWGITGRGITGGSGPARGHRGTGGRPPTGRCRTVSAADRTVASHHQCHTTTDPTWFGRQESSGVYFQAPAAGTGQGLATGSSPRARVVDPDCYLYVPWSRPTDCYHRRRQFFSYRPSPPEGLGMAGHGRPTALLGSARTGRIDTPVG